MCSRAEEQGWVAPRDKSTVSLSTSVRRRTAATAARLSPACRSDLAHRPIAVGSLIDDLSFVVASARDARKIIYNGFFLRYCRSEVWVLDVGASSRQQASCLRSRQIGPVVAADVHRVVT